MLSELGDAAAIGDLARVRELVEQGTPLNEAHGGWTPLLRAVLAGHHGVVAALLEHGADPNGLALDGSTPLILAALWADAGMLRLLLAQGADPALTDREGRSALDFARTRGDVEMQIILTGWRKESCRHAP